MLQCNKLQTKKRNITINNTIYENTISISDFYSFCSGFYFSFWLNDQRKQLYYRNVRSLFHRSIDWIERSTSNEKCIQTWQRKYCTKLTENCNKENKLIITNHTNEQLKRALIWKQFIITINRRAHTHIFAAHLSKQQYTPDINTIVMILTSLNDPAIAS